LIGSRGRSLFRRAWLPPDPARALLLVHGFAEHSGRYEEMGAWLAARGCAVHAYDQQGHGQTPGRRGHVQRFDHLLDDLGAALDLVCSEHPGLPAAIVGHSMGGLVAAAFAWQRNPRVTGVVVSGAALAPPELSRVRIAAARVLHRVLPRLRINAGIDPLGLSRDPEVARRYLEDPLVLRGMTAALGAELLGAIQRTAAAAAEIRVPMLLLHGEEDPLCLPQASAAFHADLSVPGSDLRIYPGLRHEIFNEPEREQVFGDLLAWIEAREAEAR
jgi:alpha-beta hydrolase superfamily lysophospholipase